MIRSISFLVAVILFISSAQTFAQTGDSFVLTTVAHSFGKLSDDMKPELGDRKYQEVDIVFKKGLIQILNNGNATFRIKSETNYTNETSVAFRYECVDADNNECVVMFEIYSQASMLNIWYPGPNVYIRYFILNPKK